jgi:hypothetical protein
MNNQKINISGSGSSTIKVGDVVQTVGDAFVRSEISLNANELRQKLLEELPAAVPAADREGIEQKVTDLSEAIATPVPDESRIKSILAMIKEHHNWAFPIITTTLRKITPWVINLIQF